VPFLVELGVQTPDGKVVKAKYDKFRQINRYLEFVRDVLPALESAAYSDNTEGNGKRTLNIIDFGCGKSYLTFALYYYLKVMNNYDIRVIGLDLKKDVIENCQALSDRLGYKDLKFLVGDISSYEGTDSADMVVTLHACDTATDYALAKAVKWNAKVILSVPCCQHEVNKQIACDELKPALKYGLIKERMSALFTDAIRANLLEQQGYDTQLLEFIDIEHTPKNILIRAVKKGHMKYNSDKGNRNGLEAMMEFLNINPTLQKLL
jgi:SAM-dependent methyltransferase